MIYELFLHSTRIIPSQKISLSSTRAIYMYMRYQLWRENKIQHQTHCTTWDGLLACNLCFHNPTFKLSCSFVKGEVGGLHINLVPSIASLRGCVRLFFCISRISKMSRPWQLLITEAKLVCLQAPMVNIGHSGRCLNTVELAAVVAEKVNGGEAVRGGTWPA